MDGGGKMSGIMILLGGSLVFGCWRYRWAEIIN
jgi:hypothetical protein